METWIIIKGWPDYEISDQRRVRKRSSGEILKQWNGSVRLARNRYKRTWRKVSGLMDRGSVKQYIPPTTKDLSEPGEIWKRIGDYMVSDRRRCWSWKVLRFVGGIPGNGTARRVSEELFGYDIPALTMEEWRRLDNYPSIAISNLGRIWSDKHRTILQAHKHNRYCVVNIGRKYFKVHRLVAMAFLPNPTGLPQVDHINENKRDNRAANLRWCTAEQNRAYYAANHPYPSKSLEGQAAKTTPPSLAPTKSDLRK